MTLKARYPCSAVLACVCAIATGVALEPAALAQGSYQSSPLGGRSALLGGTGVALGVDGAAPFLNPATIARIEDTSIAFSSKFFRFTRRTVERWDQPGAVDPALFGGLDLGDTTATSEQLVTVPDSTCFFVGRKSRPKMGNNGLRAPGQHAVSFCVAKVEENLFSATSDPFYGASGDLRVSRSRSRGDVWSRWNAGPTWSHGLTDRLAIGVSLYAARAYYSRTLGLATVVEDKGSGTASTSSYQAAAEGSAWEALAHLGVTYRASGMVALGLSVRTPGVSIQDDFSVTYSSSFADSGASATTDAWEARGSFVARSPARLALGIAAEWTRLRIELDAFFYPGLTSLARADLNRQAVRVDASGIPTRSRSKITFVEDANPVINVGTGAEIFLTRELSLLFGILTDFTAIPPFTESVKEGDRLFMERKTAVHASLGFVSYTQYGDLMAGFRFDAGSGQMRAVNAFTSPARLDPVYFGEIGGMFILAGRLSLRTLTGTVQSLGEAVDAPKPVTKPTEPMRAPVKKE